MLTEICQELRNWFNRNIPAVEGDFTIINGEISGADSYLKTNQYYRIIGSVFNDGVHQYGTKEVTENNVTSIVPIEPLNNEKFTGSIWPMAIPAAVIALDAKIEAWEAKYGAGDGVERSPFDSESFGGYSYAKSSGGSSGDSSVSKNGSWKAAFAYDLNRWRKI